MFLFPAGQNTVWHPPSQTLKDATDTAIKSATYMLNPRSRWLIKMFQRSAARMAAREAQGRCEARRLCCSEDSGFSQSLSEESKEAPMQEVTVPLALAMLVASLIASIMPSHRRAGAL
jgi:hypothetical protein